MVSRRDFLKVSAATSASALLAAKGRFLQRALAAPLAHGLSDPALQPKFVENAPNALDPGFIFEPANSQQFPDQYKVAIKQTRQYTGLINPNSGKPLATTIWGYGYDDERGVTWPGRTFQVKSV
ncbi:MAG: twin-arginine translocation signal domain-containing protein, partial [Anaerolineales bacterium]